MDITIYPGKLFGTVQAIPSKSQAHRYLICSAFSDKPTQLYCPETNQDIEATVSCLVALGAVVKRIETGYIVEPIKKIPDSCILDCGESGSTLRFILPVVGALGVTAEIHMHGRLPSRPLSPLWEEMERMGCRLQRKNDGSIQCSGKLQAGNYSIAGNVSSQFISGLLFAMSIMNGHSSLTITGKLESKPYADMTLAALHAFGIQVQDYSVCGKRPMSSPGKITVEGDWSNAAFFLAAASLNNPVTTKNLATDSPQGDRIVTTYLDQLNAQCTINAEDTPDLIPILSVVAAAKHGATFTNIERLRIKESDRVSSTETMLRNLGIKTASNEHSLTVYPGNFIGGTVNTFNDHRIAMSAAIAATIASGPVTILGAQCVNKSYPSFWEVYGSLGGNYEQHIR